MTPRGGRSRHKSEVESRHAPHQPHVAILVALYPQLGTMRRDITAHDHAGIVFVLINADLSR